MVGLSLGGGFPLLAGPAEARLFDDLPGVRRVFERTLVTAVGRRVREDDASGAQRSIMARFRAANVRHAEVLTVLLDVAPLTRARLDALIATIGHRFPAGNASAPLGIALTAFGAGLPFGRALAAAAGFGLVSSWLFTIAGDMVYFGLGMASTLWFDNLLGGNLFRWRTAL